MPLGTESARSGFVELDVAGTPWHVGHDGHDGATLTSETTYDARGRLEQDPEREIRYTSFDLPREITTAAGVTRFDYDAAGARVRKAGPAGTTVTLGGLYERRQGPAGTKHVFLVPGSDGLMVAQVVVEESSGERRVQYLHQDAQGSVTLVTDADGRADKSAYAYYEPFGRRIERDGAPLGGLMAELRLGLTGHEHDDELGLINMKGRIYDPKLKRVLTPDPVVSAPLFGQSYNRYSYVLNDPMNLVDPTGYEPTGPDCTTCAPWTPPQPPWDEGGGGVTIISGGSGDGHDGNPYSRDGSADDRDDIGPPPQVVRSDVDGFQGAGAGLHQGSLLVQLLNERARQDRLYYEALQRDTFRVTQWAMLGAGAALLVWSGGYALLAIEELSVLGGAIGLTSTQAAAANAASFTMKAVPAILGEVWVMEGLSQNDPGRIADGLMMAAAAGASFGEGLGAGPRAGGGAATPSSVTRTATVTQESIEHIALRHFPTSGATGAGKFDTTSIRSVRSLINETVMHGASRPNTRGRPGQILEYNFGRQIGTDVSGAPATRLRVVVTPGGVVKTAFPY